MSLNLTEQEVQFLADYIVESDAIEQVVRERSEVLEQLRTEYAEGHVGAYVHLLRAIENGEMLSESLIREVQGLIVAEQPKYGQRALAPHHIGGWRTIRVIVGGRECPSPIFVPEYMEHFARHIRAWQKQSWVMVSPLENVRFIARSHFVYLIIHPFADGNGRSSRAIVYFLYRFAKIPPFIFTSFDRHSTYYPCFNNRDDKEDMMGYFVSRTTLPSD